jgi:hypothetical protein
MRAFAKVVWRKFSSGTLKHFENTNSDFALQNYAGFIYTGISIK